jgi:hypothetical protein
MFQHSGRLFLLVTLVSIVVSGAWVFEAHRQGLANLRLCGSMKPGGARDALLRAFGTPKAHSMNPAGTRLVLLFPSPLSAAHPIRAVVNVRDDLVVEIDCGDGRIRTTDQY